MTLTDQRARRYGRRAARAAKPDASDISAALLAWYDEHRRELPWRAAPGETPDPYRVWLSEIMLQQTIVKTVVPYFARFLARFPDVTELAAAELEAVLKIWAGLGYYSRARNLHACARILAEQHGGEFPQDESELRNLPGIGPYTAAAIAAIAFGRPATPVDGNVERVVARLFAFAEPLPAGKSALKALAGRLTPETRAGDFAQAMMDLGATVCTPKTPACPRCPLNGGCLGRARGLAEALPVKTGKRAGKLRRGAAFVALRADDAVLLRRRPDKGLLGGMTETPTTAWSHDFDARTATAHAPRLACRPAVRWRRRPGVVAHVFTHFPLELEVYVARLPARTPPPAGMRFVPIADLAGEALPNLMRKVLAHALGSG